MNNKYKLGAIAFAALLVMTILGIFVTRQDAQDKTQSQVNQQKQTDTPNQLRQIQQDVPIADYNETLPSNLTEKTKREKKNKARNLKENQPGEAKRFMLTEQSQTTYGGVATHSSDQPAIPAKQSDAVIVGEVKTAKAYLSEDKTSIYSEFEISNPEVLKNTVSEPIDAKKQVPIIRSGGGVKLPSGKVIYRFNLVKPMPKIGKKYVFFLKYSDDTGFSIITAYELEQGQVIPLDGVMPKGNVVRQYTGQHSFKGMSEADFINQVKEAIEKNTDVIKKGEIK